MRIQGTGEIGKDSLSSKTFCLLDCRKELTHNGKNLHNGSTERAMNCKWVLHGFREGEKRSKQNVIFDTPELRK